MAKRRIDAVEQATRHIELNGDWVELATTMSIKDFYECQDPADIYDKNVRTCQKLIKAWSFVGEDGQSLPCTPDNILENMDAEIMFDVMAEITQLPFLKRMLARANQDS